jgi:hypothetical protein
MRCRLAIAGALLLLHASTALAEAERVATLRLSSLQKGTQLFLRADDCAYRVELLDARSGEAMVTRMEKSAAPVMPEKVFLIGATSAPQPGDGGFGLVLMGELHEGMAVEVGLGSLEQQHRLTTGKLRSIEIE